MSDVRPVDVAQHSFRVSFRGFDQAEVRSYLTELGTEIQRLRDQTETLARRLEQAGGGQHDFDALSHEIGQILTTAKEAADGLRRRATDEVTRWRTEAQAEVDEQRRSSAADAEAMRTDAWVASSAMLAQAQEMSAAIVAEAAQEAEALRASSEREALALTGQTERDTHRMLASARRESEELLRLAKMESERLLAEARAEHEEIIEVARKSAEASQERARALEVRRAEMLEELESVRKTVAKVESDLEEKRSALESAVLEPEPEPEPTTTVKVLPSEADDRSSWPEDSVRIIPAQRFDDDDTDSVDAAVIADEVRRMRERAAVDTLAAEMANGRRDRDAPAEPAADEPVPEADTDLPEEPDEKVEAESALPPKAEPAAGDDAFDSPPGQSPTAQSPPAQSPPAQSPPAESPPADDGATAESPVATADPAPADEPADEPAADALVGLFASLRDGGPVLESLAQDPLEAPAEALAEAPQEERAPSPQADVAAAPSTGVPVVPAGVDPMGLRDQLLLPITNRILRSVKRQLTEAQNIALEEIRVSDGVWTPSVGALSSEVSGDFLVLAQESIAAGYAGVETLAEKSAGRPKPMPEDIVEYSAEFADALLNDLAHHLERVEGARQVGAVVSKTYRVWRTDEAERRLRGYARLGYHRGVARALATIGTQRVLWLVAGRGCSDCRTMAEHGPVDPADGFGDNHLVPPLHDECSCTIVPSS